MKAVIFDIQLGASGDMLLAALLDLGLDPDALRTRLQGLGLSGWELRPDRIIKHHIRGMRAGVSAREETRERHLSDIRAIMEAANLERGEKDDIMKVFTTLARAEAAVHGSEIEHVHFHEVGALDSIVDIAAFCLGVRMLGIGTILFTDFCFGSGTVVTRHGEMPEPVPAVLELSRGFRIRITPRTGEMITPTAAAILVALGAQIQGTAGYVTLGSGVGFGTRDYGVPSYTRAILVEAGEPAQSLLQIEFTIDDMNPQIYPHLIARAIELGARDAYIAPVIMKKGRPGTLVTVLAPEGLRGRLGEMIFRETTTLGIRSFPVDREILERKFESVTIAGREIRIKTGYYRGELVNVQPEYEDCQACARESGIALKEIMADATRKFREAKGLDR
ncbi:MAG: nickel pincer cofactor biosynthesis protein LarC [Spirochaetes bacterium]|nr:MAG: nickel pincer cofactor biosynthesis protein LarC [Spirochaetota bacterium]